jgi:dipeptidyl aminopeptidase/acylaminoacyl peptidase
MAAGVAVLAPLFLLAGCGKAPTHPALDGVKLVPLLPVYRLAYPFGAQGGYLLSPDGSRLAWTGSWYGRQTLFVRDNATGEVWRHRARGGVQWTANSRWLLYVWDPSGGENTRLYAIDTQKAGAEATDLTPWPGVKASIQQVPVEPVDHVIVRHNRRDPKLFDIYRIDLATGTETQIAKNPGNAAGAVTAPDGSFRGWQTSRDSGRTPEEKRTPLAQRRPVLEKLPDDAVRVLGRAPDGSALWVLSNRGRERTALVQVHPTLGWEKVLVEDPLVDVGRVLMNRATGSPVVALLRPGLPKAVFLDDDFEKLMRPVLAAQKSPRVGFDVLGADRAERRLVVNVFSETFARDYLVDRETGRFDALGDGMPSGVGAHLAQTDAVLIDARDGRRLPAYVTLPRGVQPRRLPMVLWVHGGPWQRNDWAQGEDAAFAQFFANRGYAVLRVDYRGSTGYGRSHQKSAIGEFAGRMQDDLHDGVRWAVERGLADPDRVAIAGWSYGGYAALVGMTMTPGAFACGVSYNGPTDLATLIEGFPPYWTVDLSMWYDYVGNPKVPDDRADMNARSPLHHAARAQRPILVVQGGHDVRVRIDQGDRMVQALQSAGKPVEYLRIPEMAHGLGYWAHRVKVLRRTEDFLHRCLGGRTGGFDPLEGAAWVRARLPR